MPTKPKAMQRLFINVSDLMIITGTSDRNCRKIMQTLKDALGKKEHQHITFNEYCNYEGIKLKEVEDILHLKKTEKPEQTGKN